MTYEDGRARSRTGFHNHLSSSLLIVIDDVANGNTVPPVFFELTVTCAFNVFSIPSSWFDEAEMPNVYVSSLQLPRWTSITHLGDA